MALTPGRRLGVYEVTAQIGEGGMGEVFRARDTKLNRDVALKILPDAFASDPDRLARFTREAQTLASLNHPNIAHIYGLDRQDGREGAGRDGRTGDVVHRHGTAADANPLGRVVRTTPEPGYPEAVYEIVGVVKDTKYADLREETPPIAYVPVTQHPNLRPFPGVVIRSVLPPSDLIGEVRRRVNELNPDVVMGFIVFRTQMHDRVVRERTMAWLAGGFGLLATLMSTMGLYGVTSYMTVRRRQEIAIRCALGASRSTIVSLILLETAITLGVGIPLGVAVAAAVVRGAGGLLFGLSPYDPQTLAASAVLLTAVAVVASSIPAILATRIDPTEALRAE